MTTDMNLDSNCWKIVTIAGTIVLGLVGAIKILWAKCAEERREAEKARQEIVDLHKKRIDELEGFRRMVESRGPKP